MTNFGDFQVGIYLDGMMNGQTRALTTNLARLEDQAREVLPPESIGYIVPSAGDGATARANREAFDRWRIVPRMLRGAVERDLSCTVLGTEMAAPVLIAPIGASSRSWTTSAWPTIYRIPPSCPGSRSRPTRTRGGHVPVGRHVPQPRPLPRQPAVPARAVGRPDRAQGHRPPRRRPGRGRRRRESCTVQHPVAQAFWLLRIGFAVAPILFGLDKFAHVLVARDVYIASEFTDLLGADAHPLMYFVADRDIPVVICEPRDG